MIVVVVVGIALGIWGRRFGEDLTTGIQQRYIGQSDDRPKGYRAEIVYSTVPFSGRRQLLFLLVYPERTRISIEGGSSSFRPDSDGIDIYGRRLYLDGIRVHVDPNRPIMVLSDRERRCLSFPAPEGLDRWALDPNLPKLTASAVWKQQIQPAIELEEQYNRQQTDHRPRRGE